MPYEIASDTVPLQHRLVLEGRERLTVTGVEDVERFEDSAVVMTTCVGTLVVTGQGLHIGKLSLDGGELHVDGRVESFAYEELPAGGSGGFWQRFFG